MAATRRKFNRKTDQRSALLTGLLVQLIEYGSIRTTLERAKEVKPKIDKLVTESKKGTLAARRSIISKLDNNVRIGHKLVDVIAVATAGRNSGYVRVVREDKRRGDNAQMARISFVDSIELSDEPTSTDKKTRSSSTVAEKPTSAASSKAKAATKTKKSTK